MNSTSTILFIIAITLQTYATIEAIRLIKHVLWPKPWLAFTIALGLMVIIFSSELYYHFIIGESIPVYEGILALMIALLMAYNVGYSSPSVRRQNLNLKQKTEQKKRAEHRLSLINNFSSKLIKLNTEDELIWYVVKEIEQQTRFKDCVIYLHDEEKNVLVQSAAIGPKNPEKYEITNKIEIPFGRGITGCCAESKEAIIVDNVQEDERYIAELDFSGSEICIPIVHDGRLFGVIDCEHPDIGYFTKDHLDILNTVAAMLATRLAQWEAMKNLQRTQKTLLEAQAISHLGNWYWDMKTGQIQWSDEIFRIFGLEPQSFKPSYDDFLAAIPPQDRDRVDELARSMMEPENTEAYNIDHSITLPDGSIRFVNEQGIVHFGEDGNPASMSGTVQDITERMLAEKSTNKTKEQLRQSQKMEAVGQLTGGISHDFNNLLAIILGNLQLLEMNINSDKPVNKKQLKEAVEESIKAGKKGADLTKRLLSFSRKQVLSSSTLIVNQVINDMGSMLTRTLGEHIELAVELDNNLWPVETDISQLENALLNMSINSRDAMPRGGKLIIKTSNINVKKGFIKQHPEFQTGDYVLLEVSDTGTGMDAKTLKKVFEPFFTTKEVGKGSGLGLSMVYGFAKQSGGQVVIVSDVGIGTSIKIYLPRAKATEVNVKKVEKGLSNLTGSETILLVEDDDGVRKVFVRLLDNLGYNVLAARDGDEAIKILGDIEHIDMLLSDVVLPGAISGPEIGKIAQQHFPNIKILYVSGYTEDNHIIQDIEDDNVNLLSKPFEPSELSSKIREIIDN